jgi:hypothetical protein
MSEYLINKETGESRLVETGIRGDGAFISSDLVPLACGVNVNALLIELASGNRKRVVIDKNKLYNHASGCVFFHPPEGIISRVKGIDKVNSLSGVYRAYLQDLEVGKQIRPMSDKTQRLGPILIAGKDRPALQEIIQQIQETLIVEIETSEGIKGIKW